MIRWRQSWLLAVASGWISGWLATTVVCFFLRKGGNGGDYLIFVAEKKRVSDSGGYSGNCLSFQQIGERYGISWIAYTRLLMVTLSESRFGDNISGSHRQFNLPGGCYCCIVVAITLSTSIPAAIGWQWDYLSGGSKSPIPSSDDSVAATRLFTSWLIGGEWLFLKPACEWQWDYSPIPLGNVTGICWLWDYLFPPPDGNHLLHPQR